MSDQLETKTPARPTRRAILKTGAHAAWAVPAIQIAAATPAFAASGVAYPTAVLALAPTHTRNGDNGTLTVQVSVTQANAKGVVVTVSGADITATQSHAVGPVLVGSPVSHTFNVTFASGKVGGNVTITANGTTDNPGNAATSETRAYSMPKK